VGDVNHQVEITKGPKVSEYRVNSETFAKCGVGVPEQVTKLLGIAPKSSINFAGQFDRPFLLDDTGSAVAHELGELTNVSIILDAAREGNRRKGEVAGLVKAKESDLASLVDQVRAFAGLAGRQAAISEAEQLVKQAEQMSDTSVRLTGTVTDLRVAHGVVERLAVLPEPIDLTEVEAAYAELVELRATTNTAKVASSALMMAGDVVPEFEKAESAALTEFQTQLRAEGTCPLCGQATH
jgi:hypothetical protein